MIAKQQNEGLARALRAARLASGYSLRAAAAEAGMGHGHIHQIEHGQVHPGLRTVKKLCAVYGVSWVEILVAADRMG